MKKIKEFYNKIYKVLKTLYISKLYASLKEKLNRFVKRFERKPLNLDFNMEKFFTEEGRVKENRQRLRELYDQYKRIENYYPIFLAYLTAIGIFLFDLISFGINHLENHYYILLTVITLGSIIYTCYLIWKVFKGNNWTHDYLPKGVYEDYDSDVNRDFPELKKGTEEFNKQILKFYYQNLEEIVEDNLTVYTKKRKNLSLVWKPMIISLILFSLNITFHKSITMKEEMNEGPGKVIVVEDSNNQLDNEFTPNQISKIKEIVHDEILKYNKGDLKGELILNNLEKKTK